MNPRINNIVRDLNSGKFKILAFDNDDQLQDYYDSHRLEVVWSMVIQDDVIYTLVRGSLYD